MYLIWSTTITFIRVKFIICFIVRYNITNFTLYYDDYIKLYIDTIRPIVLKEDTTRPFVSSSPSNGVQTEKEGWVAKNPTDVHYGDGK